MSTLPIVKDPDPILKQKTGVVETFDEELHTFLGNMAETMYEANGIGLAAPQVGDLRRITVVDVSRDGNDLLELINPQIVHADGTCSGEEGCLSIPEYRDIVERNEAIKVEAFDRHGNEIKFEAEGILSICIQHELDHLDGVLFIDRLSYLKKQLFKKWFRKNGPFE